MGDRPTGTVTFLFTDVEGSTRLWEEYPDEMQVGLATHDEILRSSIEACGGYVFSTAGDMFAAAFSSADDAVEAAATTQAALRGADWPDPIAIRVRMGLHVGVAQERDGDYFGPTLNRAARIMGAAHGEQVIASAAVADLAQQQLVPLGEHRLKDLSAPEQLYQLGAATFPPLRSLDVVPGNLPTSLTELVGRDDDVRALTDLLERERLVTLAGPGGVGKTRLALAVAGEVADRFEDGAWFVDLASVTSAGDLAAATVRTLGAPAVGEASEVLRGWLSARQILLVVDNCEHVIDAAADLVDDLLAAGSGVKVLTTSRELLDLPGEMRWAVPTLEGGAAVELFLSRAQRVRPEPDSSSDRKRIAEVCAELDGMPLAIELAAAMLRSMTVDELAASLGGRLDLLRGGRRTAPRHRTLRATVEWSYDLLPDPLRAPFCRLSVMAAPFDVDACVAVTGLSNSAALRTLDDLVARSMIVAEPTDLGTRYRLLDTLRTYGRERLGDEAGRIEELAALHILTWVERVSIDLEGPDDIRAWDLIDDQWPNIVASVNWFFGTGDSESAARIATALIPGVAALRTDIREWIQRLDGEPLTAGTEQGLRCAAVLDAWLGGRPAQRHLERAVELASVVPNPHASLQWVTGVEAYQRGAAEETVAALDPERDPTLAPFWREWVTSMRVFGLVIGGQAERARDQALLARRDAESFGNTYQIMIAAFAAGRAHVELGELDHAIANYQEAIQLAERTRNRFIPMVARGILASGLARSGRVRECLEQLRICIRDGLGGSRPESIAIVWFNYAAIVFHDLGRLDDAAWCLSIAEDKQTYSRPTPDEEEHLDRIRTSLATHLPSDRAQSSVRLDAALHHLDRLLEQALTEVQAVPEL